MFSDVSRLARSMPLQPPTTSPLPTSPTSKESSSFARSRHLWTMAFDNVLEHDEDLTGSSAGIASSAGNPPPGWQRLTRGYGLLRLLLFCHGSDTSPW